LHNQTMTITSFSERDWQKPTSITQKTAS
jgi:hypothetical protein